MSNFKERINSLKLNVKQHQDQIKILLKEIKKLENYKGNSNENNNLTNINLDNFCVSNDIKKNTTKNENLNKFI